MNKFNISSLTVKDICKSENNFKLFQIVKCEMGNSKSMKTTKILKMGMSDKLEEWDSLSRAVPFYNSI